MVAYDVDAAADAVDADAVAVAGAVDASRFNRKASEASGVGGGGWLHHLSTSSKCFPGFA